MARPREQHHCSNNTVSIGIVMWDIHWHGDATLHDLEASIHGFMKGVIEVVVPPGLPEIADGCS